MRLTINGEPEAWQEETTLDEVVRAITTSTRGVAVAVNGVVVPRTLWPSTTLVEGAAVEVLVAAAGG